MILTAPEIWTPRNGAWWRLPRWSPADLLDRFTAGKLQRKSTGKAQRKTATGKMRRNGATSSTCCCPIVCSHCLTTPTVMQVVFSGLSFCACATTGISGGSSGNLSGTVPAFAICCNEQQTCTECFWETELAAADHSLRGTLYSDVACATPNGISASLLYVRVGKTSNTFLNVFATLHQATFRGCTLGGGTGFVDVFSGSVTTSSLSCSGTFTVNNGLLCGTSPTFGGTATVTTVCS